VTPKENEMNATNYRPDTSKAFLSNEELTQLLAISGELEDEIPALKKSTTHHLYMQFLQISLANRPQKNLVTLTLNEQHLLEQIAIRCEIGNPINVTEACQMHQFGCISTVHHQIHKLNTLGLIFLEADQDDLRKKLINLSPDGLEYFKQIEDCLDLALMRQ
jgi:DNA-binding MarR family transcriptional regulator